MQLHLIFCAIALVLVGCSEPISPDLPIERPFNPSADLAEALEGCGLDTKRLFFFEGEAGDRQYRYIRSRSLAGIGEPQIACIARVLVIADIGLRTKDERLNEAYEIFWQKERAIYERKLAREWLAVNYPSLVVPQFTGEQADLADFVAAVERLCNAPKGTAVANDPPYIYLPWPQEPVVEAGCVYDVLTASNLHEHGIRVELGGVP